MQRREFLKTGAAAGAASLITQLRLAHAGASDAELCCGPKYPSPAEAMRAPREKLLYVVALYAGTRVNKPDYLATVDVDPASPTYSQVVHRLPMPNVGDELHHFGWNACSSCHSDPTRQRRYLIVPGFKSGRVHVIDVKNPRSPAMHKVVEPEEIARKTNLSAPHTVHCLPDGRIMLSMLGDAQGNAPGGFLLLDANFNVVGRWEANLDGMNFNYDYWYQPRHNAMVSSEWAAPNTFRSGFKPADVKAGKFGHHLHFWDWKERRIAKSIDLGETGMIPLEVRFHHNPDSTHGFAGAALSSTLWHWHRTDGQWQADKVVSVGPIKARGTPGPMPALITDLLVSMDDRYVYFSNWLHGDLRQYDVRDPAHPKLTGRVWCGGLLGRTGKVAGRNVTGGPQMLQLSLDGRRLYVTNSLYSSWDNQFYPEISSQGSYLLQIDCEPEGGMKINERFYVDFGREPDGPARAHEMRFPGGDCTSDIWV